MGLTISGDAAVVEPVLELRNPKFTLAVPSDKSITHRSIIFSAMAKGVSTIQNPLWGEDCRHTLGVFKELGCKVEPDPKTKTAPDTITVTSPGIDRWQTPLVPLDFGNSGTTARLLTGLFAAKPGLFVTCFGDESLSSRPMGRVVKPLKLWGADIMGRDGGSYLPLAINGRELLSRRETIYIDKASAQIKSALLLAAMQLPGKSSLVLPRGARNHTEIFLQKFGAELQIEHEGGREHITLNGPVRPTPGHYKVPSDPSSVAFFAVVAGLFPGTAMTFNGVLDNPTRCGFLKVLERMGMTLEKQPASDGDYVEPSVQLTCVMENKLRATDISPEEVPALVDEIPILATLATYAEGVSRFRDLGELRVKESDRLVKTAELLQLGGATVTVDGDDLVIVGNPGFQRRGFTYDPVGDHRLAMAACVWGLRGAEPVRVENPLCVSVSFPTFFDLMTTLV